MLGVRWATYELALAVTQLNAQHDAIVKGLIKYDALFKNYEEIKEVARKYSCRISYSDFSLTGNHFHEPLVISPYVYDWGYGGTISVTHEAEAEHKLWDSMSSTYKIGEYNTMYAGKDGTARLGIYGNTEKEKEGHKAALLKALNNILISGKASKRNIIEFCKSSKSAKVVVKHEGTGFAPLHPYRKIRLLFGDNVKWSQSAYASWARHIKGADFSILADQSSDFDVSKSKFFKEKAAVRISGEKDPIDIITMRSRLRELKSLKETGRGRFFYTEQEKKLAKDIIASHQAWHRPFNIIGR